ncbi:MAG: hypothetical protein U1F25_02020 [Rubrivivax sp.]
MSIDAAATAATAAAAAVRSVGIAGTGGIGLASAAWLARAGFAVTLWSPRGSVGGSGIGSSGAEALKREPLAAHGVFEAVVPVAVAADARELAARSDFIVIAVPMNAHRAVMDALLPHLGAPPRAARVRWARCLRCTCSRPRNGAVSSCSSAASARRR